MIHTHKFNPKMLCQGRKVTKRKNKRYFSDEVLFRAAVFLLKMAQKKISVSKENGTWSYFKRC